MPIARNGANICGTREDDLPATESPDTIRRFFASAPFEVSGILLKYPFKKETKFENKMRYAISESKRKFQAPGGIRTRSLEINPS